MDPFTTILGGLFITERLTKLTEYFDEQRELENALKDFNKNKKNNERKYLLDYHLVQKIRKNQKEQFLKKYPNKKRADECWDLFLSLKTYKNKKTHKIYKDNKLDAQLLDKFLNNLNKKERYLLGLTESEKGELFFNNEYDKELKGIKKQLSDVQYCVNNFK